MYIPFDKIEQNTKRINKAMAEEIVLHRPASIDEQPEMDKLLKSLEENGSLEIEKYIFLVLVETGTSLYRYQSSFFKGKAETKKLKIHGREDMDSFVVYFDKEEVANRIGEIKRTDKLEVRGIMCRIIKFLDILGEFVVVVEKDDRN